MERLFPRTLDALGHVSVFIEHFVGSVEADPALVAPLNLAIEEIFVNMVEYNSDGEETVSVTLEREGDQLLVILRDRDSDEYDITQHEAPDVRAPLDEREPRGLGIHLVKKVMDEVQYEYRDRQTTITLVKNIPPSDAHV